MIFSDFLPKVTKGLKLKIFKIGQMVYQIEAKNWTTEGRPHKNGRPKVGYHKLDDRKLGPKWSSGPMGQYIGTKLTRRVSKSGSLLNPVWFPIACRTAPACPKSFWSRAFLFRESPSLSLASPGIPYIFSFGIFKRETRNQKSKLENRHRNSKSKPEIETRSRNPKSNP